MKNNKNPFNKNISSEKGKSFSENKNRNLQQTETTKSAAPSNKKVYTPELNNKMNKPKSFSPESNNQSKNLNNQNDNRNQKYGSNSEQFKNIKRK